MKAILNTKTLYEVFILSDDGQRVGPFRAAFPCDCEVLIYAELFDVNNGGKLIQALPDGLENTYTIMDVSYDPDLDYDPLLYSASSFTILKINKDISK